MSAPPVSLVESLQDRYRVERELGRGGMATVWLAQDLRHDRKVALKVLRPELSAVIGAERFLAEIRVTANLQHPHILPLFDSGRADGSLYYVMPYVQGESLRDRLTREKQLPIADAVRIATEVAAALDYAHRHGVIHRDIKPENILLHDGTALVADFGIALAVSQAGGARMTETGMSLGTPHYMSPEQAMGEREITARSDVYALGAVTYEMLTGDPPFVGSTAQAILAKVLTEKPPPIRRQRERVAESLEDAVLTALEKLPADRFASAAQFSEALASPATSGAVSRNYASRPGAPRVAASRGIGPQVAWAMAGTAAILAAVTAWRTRTSVLPPVPHPVVRFTIQLPQAIEPVTAYGSTIAFSPDGSHLAYVGRDESRQRLYLRRMDSPEPTPIPGTENARQPFFSADGAWLGFDLGFQLARVSVSGGPVIPICSTSEGIRGATWSVRDTITFASDSGLMEVPARGGTPRLVARPDSGEVFRFPEAMPGGEVVLFGVRGRKPVEVAAFVRSTGQIRRIGQPGGYPRWVDAGYLVVTSASGIISAVPFDPDRLEVTGSPIPIADQAPAYADGNLNLAISRTGDVAYQAFPFEGQSLALVDRTGVVRDSAGASGRRYAPKLSPDGRRIAVVQLETVDGARRDVWLSDLVQGTNTRLTFDSTGGWPLWSADGRSVAYTRWPNGSGTTPGMIAIAPADGSGPARDVATQAGEWTAAALDSNGLLYYGRSAGAARTQIWRISLESGAKPQPVIVSRYDNFAASLSPDGKWLTYVSNETDRWEVYVRPYPGPGGRTQVSVEGGGEPIWSGAGGEIFYRVGQRLMSATVRTSPTFEVTGRRTLFTGDYATAAFGDHNYSVARDGRTFAMLRPVRGSQQAVILTLHWFDNLGPGAKARR
jgi:serine/threonine-protein kinase